MKIGITKLIMVAAIAALVVIAGSTVAWAQGCPASPNYSPDFTSNQSCLTPNGTPAGSGYPTFAPAATTTATVLRLTPTATYTAGSAWYNTAQSVAGGFSTSFTFQLSGGGSPPADGIAFVIQNSALTALGAVGCGIGFGDDQISGCTSNTGGIPNSLALVFKSYDDGYPSPYPDTANSVAIQSNGTGANCIDDSCTIAVNNSLPNGIIMADGTIHSVTIIYTPPPTGSGPGSLDVLLDGNDLFPGGVPFDLTSIGLATGGTAFVGFTAATGGSYDFQDILSWTFYPGAQSGTATTGTTLDLNFDGGTSNGGYDANVLLLSGSPETVQVNPITTLTQAECNALVNPTFPGAQCFSYKNGQGPGIDGPVLFEYTCPGSLTGGTCGSASAANFFATLGTDFIFNDATENPGFYSNLPLPEVGWLKGAGGNPLNPCTPNLNNSPALFSSNQIVSFTFADPPNAGTVGNGKGSSSGTGSCWLLTYLTPNEAPSVNVIAPANGGTYQLGQATSANFPCTTVNEGSSSPTGPYLTLASCTAIDSVGGSVAQGAQFDTSTLGPHTFTATVVDSATNTVSQTVTYNVVGATDVAILKVAPSKAATGSKLTYGIVVWDQGNANGVNVSVNDPLPPGTSFVSASGSNVACSIVNKKLTCSTLPVPCNFAGGTVSCNVGTIMPLSISSLNGAVIQITVKVTAAAGAKLTNTATVSESNADTNPSNNSSTASTTVTAH